MRTKILKLMFASLAGFSLLLVSCSEDDKPLAPYSGVRSLGGINIEEGSFAPKVTWLGGYVTVFGVNQDSVAKLDSTLIMLIYAPGNKITFPVKFGKIPDGSQNLLNQYGGQQVDSLEEDRTYTFWILKEDAWNEVTANPKMPIQANANVENVQVTSDTVFVNPANYAGLVKPLDVFVNLRNVDAKGRLGSVNIVQTNKVQNPTVTWEITQDVSGNTRLTAMGLVKGPVHSPTEIVWEVWSEEFVDGQPVYGTQNVISQPVVLGQSFPATRTFYELPAEGLERNQTYYLWIATKDWDKERHSRAADYYAYLTFQTL